jgi:N-acetyl-gamma-glutamyl-phosphate reductase
VGARVAVAGATGYAGGELLRLLAAHPYLELGAVTGHTRAGVRLGSVHPQLVSLAGIEVAATSPAALADADLVFLALPHGESAALAAALPPQVKVVDLGADHRLHEAWTYGLPELPGRRAAIAGANRVANTGCYAVATILALAPLIAAGLAEPDDVVVVAASGTSGAGRTLLLHLLASEVMSSLSPYRVGVHQHVPEIKQAAGARSVSFTPVLAPMPRGILATVTARPAKPGLSRAVVREVLLHGYADEPFIHVLPEDVWPRTAATLGGNAAHLQATVDADSGRIIVVTALDNLGKGAAGQAIQCANLMLGLPEAAGLTANGVGP